MNSSASSRSELARKLNPAQCTDDWARFFDRDAIRPTLGCFSEHKPRLPTQRLAQSVHEVPGLAFNVYRHGTVTTTELNATSALD